MATLQQRLSENYQTVNLQENDINQRFLFVYGDIFILGIFKGFNINNPGWINIFRTDKPYLKIIPIQYGQNAPNNYVAFRRSDIKENILNIINDKKTPSQTKLSNDIIRGISHYGGIIKKTKKTKKTRKIKKRKQFKRKTKRY